MSEPWTDEKKLELFGLLLKPPISLTEEQLDEIEKYVNKLSNMLCYLSHAFPDEWTRARQRLVRKRELDKFGTKELWERMEVFYKERIQVISEDVDEHELPDSFFEAFPIDSDAHIILELLRGRVGE